MPPPWAGLFGEDPANRRERLRSLLASMMERGVAIEKKEEPTPILSSSEVRGQVYWCMLLSMCMLQVDEGVWFHEGPEELLSARY